MVPLLKPTAAQGKIVRYDWSETLTLDSLRQKVWTHFGYYKPARAGTFTTYIYAQQYVLI